MSDQSRPRSPKLRTIGTVYHVVIESPSLKEWTALGPFHSIEDTVTPLVEKLTKISPRGLPAFEEIRPSWTAGRIRYLKAPLEGGKHCIVRLEKEHNPTVAAALPGPAWTVTLSKFDVEAGYANIYFGIIGSYLTKEKAFAAARKTMSGLLETTPLARRWEDVSWRGNLTIVSESNGINGTDYLVHASLDQRHTLPDNHSNNKLGYRQGKKTKLSTRCCDKCGAHNGDNGEPLKRCSNCKQTLYCGRDCQKADLDKHKTVCQRTPQRSTG